MNKQIDKKDTASEQVNNTNCHKNEIINAITEILENTPPDDNTLKFINMVIEANGTKNIKEYINKKNKYLKEHQTLTDEQFNTLFGSTSKFGKPEIRQRNLGMCKMYTAFEMLKKMNFFNETIKTHLRKIEDGWEVKYPFFSEDGIRIKVLDSETKNNYSEAKLKGFKILEIAFIKRMQGEPGPNWEEHMKNLKNTGNCVLDPESISYHERDYFFKVFKIMFNNLSITLPCNDACKDFAFKYFNKGVYGVDLLLNKNVEDEMKIEDNGELIAAVEGHIIKGGKIIKEITLPHQQSFMYKGKKMIRFFDTHSYSIERCYTSNKGEKRCWIINPWHSDIKFDISFEDCKKIFNFNLVGFDYKNMFT